MKKIVIEISMEIKVERKILLKMNNRKINYIIIRNLFYKHDT